MVKKRGYLKVFFLLSVLIILFVNLTSASFAVGNKSHLIDKRYAQSENIKGWMNISLSNEPANSLLQDSRGNSVKLIDLLNKSSNYTYSCSPVDCSTSYAASTGEISKTFSLSKGQSKIFGLRFTGDLTQVNSVGFTLDSDALQSCENQISIDILDNGATDVINDKLSSGSCSSTRNYGCYNANSEKEEYFISEVQYCQKINLSNSQGFKIGAWVKKNSGSRVLEASIYDDGTEVADCILKNVSGDIGEFSCDVNYSLTSQREHSVCISSKSGTGDYKIRGNPSPVKGCGFVGFPPTSSTPGAYEIFAEGKSFAPVGSLQVSNYLPDGKNFGSLVYNYILNKYGNLNCSPECVVPIKLLSGVNQQITIKNLSVSYQKSTGIVSENRFYELIEAPQRITSGFGKIYLDEGGFSVPNVIGTYGFSLKLSNQTIFSEDVNVTDVPKILSLDPMSTASGYPTDFLLSVNSSSGTKKFFWNFGDNTTGVTTTSTVRHTYNLTGIYKIDVTVTDTKNLSSSKTFDINVSSSKNLINTTIVKVKNSINNIRARTANFSSFSQESINSVLGIDNTTKELTSIETSFNSAQSDAQYNQLIPRLLSLNVFPKSVSETRIAKSIQFLPKKEDINLEIIKKAGGGSYDTNNEGNYADAIILWNQENIASSMTFTEFVGNYDSGVMPVVKVFEMDIRNTGNSGGSYFLIMPKLENLGFESGVVVREDNEYVYIDLTNLNSVSFYTTDDVDFTNLPAFISPGLNRLSVNDMGGSIPGEERPRWVILILVMIFLGIAAFIVYIILQEWYKRRYENYLFKNRNDLYNMVNYIHNAKKKGIHNREIAENLKKAKWSSEQIRYVMKKYAGERTGMFEIPITKLFQKNPEHHGYEMSKNHKKL